MEGKQYHLGRVCVLTRSRWNPKSTKHLMSICLCRYWMYISKLQHKSGRHSGVFCFRISSFHHQEYWNTRPAEWQHCGLQQAGRSQYVCKNMVGNRTQNDGRCSSNPALHVTMMIRPAGRWSAASPLPGSEAVNHRGSAIWKIINRIANSNVKPSKQCS